LKAYSEPGQRVRATGLHRGEAVNREIQLGQIVELYSISHGVNLLLFNLAGRHRLGGRIDGRAPVIVAARFGAGPTVPHTESRIDGDHQEQYELGRLGLQVAAGVELRLWRGLYTLGEYKFTRTDQKGKVSSGSAESLLRTHHGVFGLSYHF
jgi:hypothetical protein